MFWPIKKKLWRLSNEKQDFHAGTNVFANENLKPSYSRNGIVHIKQNETSKPIIVFYLVKLFSMFPNHFRNNEENDQYHDVSTDTNTSCSHHINMIKSADLIKCWFVVTRLLFINWNWLILEKFVLSGCTMCFAMGAKFFFTIF